GEFPVKSRDEARRKLGLPAAPTVLYTGNLAPFQGVDRLLQSMVHVVKKAPSSRLVIVGKPVANYQRKANELGIAQQVVFAGERPFEEVREFLAAADVVVLPRDNCVDFPL